MIIIEIIFWLSVFAVVYTYIGYPLLMGFLARMRRRPVAKAYCEHQVSVVLAARNEADKISARLDNLCAQDYPAEKMEIIVVSDASDDGTDEAVRNCPDSRVRLIVMPEGGGKALAVNAGVAAARNDIVVLADARQQFAGNAIRELVANFSDQQVGCAGGELIFRESGASTVQAQMGAYWAYEKMLRKSESETGSMIGASGCICAIRRGLYQPLPAGTILDDVLIPMNIVRQGYRVVFDASAVAYDIVSQSVGQEWKRKVRTLTGNWQLISLAPWLIVPGMNPVWTRFISHKICRVKVPFWLIILLIGSALLPGRVYHLFLGAQALCYLIAGAAGIVPSLRAMPGISYIYFFAVMNAAALVGFWRWIAGRTANVWLRPLARNS